MPTTNDATAHKVIKISDAEFEYRGIRFERTDVSKGYWGHYSTISNLGTVKERTGTRRDLLSIIDRHLAHAPSQETLASTEVDEIPHPGACEAPQF